MDKIMEGWRQYLKEIFETGVEVSKPAKKLSGGQNLGYTQFSINDKQYKIRMSQIGGAKAKLWQVEFFREAMERNWLGQRRLSGELLGDSAKEVFAVLSTVFGWSLKWQSMNKAKARTMVLAGKDEGKRVNVYRHMAQRAAERSGYDVKETRAADRSGEEKAVFILFDRGYLEKYPKYKEVLNKELEIYFNTTL